MHISLKRNLPDILIINLFILDVLISSTTNYQTSFFIFKFLLTAILVIVLYFNNSNKQDIRTLFPSFLIKCFSLFLLITFLSLIYSANPFFGFKKILNLIISIIPLVFIFNYLWLNLNKTTLKIFFYSIMITGVISVFFIMVISPFSFNSPYSFSLTRWSHQIYGRFIGSIFLILLFILPKIASKKKKLYLMIIAIITGYGTYTTGARSIFSGIIIVSVLFFIVNIIKKEMKYFDLLIYSLIVLSVVIAIFFFPSTSQIVNRYENSTNIENLEFNGDKQIHERYQAYSISEERIKQNPILGLGFGGFKSFYKSDIPVWMEYPHNIFLETAVELGIPGLLFIFYLLYNIFYYSYKISWKLVLFFVFGFWLSLFSKDLASQSILYLGMIFTSPR